MLDIYWDKKLQVCVGFYGAMYRRTEREIVRWANCSGRLYCTYCTWRITMGRPLIYHIYKKKLISLTLPRRSRTAITENGRPAHLAHSLSKRGELAMLHNCRNLQGGGSRAKRHLSKEPERLPPWWWWDLMKWCVVDSLKVEGDNDDGLGTSGIRSMKCRVTKACLCIR